MSRKKNRKHREQDLYMDSSEELDDAPFPPVSFTLKPLTARTVKQKEYLDLMNRYELVFAVGPAGTGKAQPLDATVYTPQGPRLMGSLRIGDEVCTPSGGVAKVLAIYPQGVKEIYSVEFENGDTVECCAEHLWLVEDENHKVLHKRSTKPLIRDTSFMLEALSRKVGKKQNRFRVAPPQPLFFKEKPTLIDPYTLGIFLGDGCFTRVATFTTADTSIREYIETSSPADYFLKNLSSSYDFQISGTKGRKNVFTENMRTYGLFGKKADKKFIPQEYLYNSVEVRLALVQGLMDTDGTVDKKTGMPNFVTTSPQLAHDFKSLIQSLGGSCTITPTQTYYTHVGEKRKGLPSYRCYIQYNNGKELFRLARKRELVKSRTKYKVKRLIRKITPIGRKAAQCILVDHPDHLYITDNFIPTHNTHLAVYSACKALRDNQVDRIIITRPIVEAGERLGFLPGDLQEKVNPYLRPIFDSFLSLLGPQKFSQLWDAGVIEVAPLAYMRGRTLSKAYIILDEAQNTTKEQMKMLLTRIGENSRCIITGDATQIDLPTKSASGLVDALKVLKNIPEIAFTEFTDEDVVRHHLVKKIVKAYEDAHE